MQKTALLHNHGFGPVQLAHVVLSPALFRVFRLLICANAYNFWTILSRFCSDDRNNVPRLHPAADQKREEHGDA